LKILHYLLFKLHGYTVHQQYPTLCYPTDAHNVKKNVELLKHFKITKLLQHVSVYKETIIRDPTAITLLKLHTWFIADTQSSHKTLSVLWLHIVTCEACVLRTLI